MSIGHRWPTRDPTKDTMNSTNRTKTAVGPSNYTAYDSCRLPPPDILGCTKYEDVDVWYETCYFRRLLLRIPICIFAIITTYLAVALFHDAAVNPPMKTTKYGNILKRLRIFATILIAIVMIYSTLSILIEESPDKSCDWFGKVENGMYWISISVVYLVLWFRQRAIFKEENLRHTVSRVTSHLSLSTIILVVVLPVVNIGLFSSSVSFCYDPVLRICGIEGYSPSIFVSELVVPILVPTCLVALFALPLIKHQRFIRDTIQNPVKGNASVIGVVRRAFTLSTICLLTDIGAILCNAYLPLLGSFVTRLLSVFANMICMNLCFSDWGRVTSFGYRTSKVRGDSSTRVRTGRLKHMTGKQTSVDNVSFDSVWWVNLRVQCLAGLTRVPLNSSLRAWNAHFISYGSYSASIILWGLPPWMVNRQFFSWSLTWHGSPVRQSVDCH